MQEGEERRTVRRRTGPVKENTEDDARDGGRILCRRL
jgi:hypothetical protein